MFRPRRLLTASLLAAWVGTILACGGADVQVKRAADDSTASTPEATVEPAGEAKAERPKADEPKKPPVAKAEKPKRWEGKLGTGANAYDDLPEPWRGKFVEDWKREVASRKDAVRRTEGEFEKAKAAVVKAQDDVDRHYAKYKDDIKTDPLTRASHNTKKAALAKAEASVKDFKAARDAAAEDLANIEKNDPPYLHFDFAGCTTPADIQDRVAILAAKNAAQAQADATKRKEDEAKRKEEEAKRKAEEEYDYKGLVLLRKTEQGKSDEFSTTVTGSVVNRTGMKIRYAQISYHVYDASGAKVATALANINNLEAGETWSFKAVGITRTGRQYKFDELLYR